MGLHCDSRTKDRIKWGLHCDSRTKDNGKMGSTMEVELRIEENVGYNGSTT